MSEKQEFKYLFSPFQIGKVQIKNRMSFSHMFLIMLLMTDIRQKQQNVIILNGQKAEWDLL